MRKSRMISMSNRYEEEEVRCMNPDSSDRIYVTASVEAQCRLISQNQNMKEEEKTKNTKVNALKRSTCVNQRANSFTRLVANLPE